MKVTKTSAGLLMELSDKELETLKTCKEFVNSNYLTEAIFNKNGPYNALNIFLDTIIKEVESVVDEK